MDWLHRLQEHLAVTRTECTALLVVMGLFLSGLVVEHIWTIRAAPSAGYYAQLDSLFEVRSRHQPDSTVRDRGTARPDTNGDTYTNSAGGLLPPARMDLNRMSARQLTQLPGIGPVLAERITTFRRQNGPFLQVEDLGEVAGIGSKTLGDLKPFLFVEEGGRRE